MQRYGPPEDPDHEPTGPANPWYLKLTILVGWGVLIGLLMALLGWGIAQLLGGGSDPASTTPSTTAATTTTTTTTTTPGTGFQLRQLPSLPSEITLPPPPTVLQPPPGR